MHGGPTQGAPPEKGREKGGSRKEVGTRRARCGPWRAGGPGRGHAQHARCTHPCVAGEPTETSIARGPHHRRAFVGASCGVPVHYHLPRAVHIHVLGLHQVGCHHLQHGGIRAQTAAQGVVGPALGPLPTVPADTWERATPRARKRAINQAFMRQPAAHRRAPRHALGARHEHGAPCGPGVPDELVCGGQVGQQVCRRHILQVHPERVPRVEACLLIRAWSHVMHPLLGRGRVGRGTSRGDSTPAHWPGRRQGNASHPRCNAVEARAVGHGKQHQGEVMSSARAHQQVGDAQVLGPGHRLSGAHVHPCRGWVGEPAHNSASAQIRRRKAHEGAHKAPTCHLDHVADPASSPGATFAGSMAGAPRLTHAYPRPLTPEVRRLKAGRAGPVHALLMNCCRRSGSVASTQTRAGVEFRDGVSSPKHLPGGGWAGRCANCPAASPDAPTGSQNPSHAGLDI